MKIKSLKDFEKMNSAGIISGLLKYLGPLFLLLATFIWYGIHVSSKAIFVLINSLTLNELLYW